jgi:hypothetical protein
MSKIRRVIAGIAALAVLIGMSSVMLIAAPTASSDARNPNKLAGLITPIGRDFVITGQAPFPCARLAG